MPYLLGMMNLLLHEVDKPNIVRTNTLRKPLREISDENQYDLIMTNPPFGGEEEEGISTNLPVGMRTSDTALGFLLYLMYSLKDDGRCAVILPNGTPLSGEGTPVKIRQKLLDEFNLHTIVQLPRSVFAPYTDQSTNILFFDKKHPTKEIWFYEMKVSDRVSSRAKNPTYSKTKPMIYEDFSELEIWMKNKSENKNAWKVNVKNIQECNLEISNPNNKEKKINLSPHKLIDELVDNEKTILNIFQDIKKLIDKEIPK